MYKLKRTERRSTAGAFHTWTRKGQRGPYLYKYYQYPLHHSGGASARAFPRISHVLRTRQYGPHAGRANGRNVPLRRRSLKDPLLLPLSRQQSRSRFSLGQSGWAIHVTQDSSRRMRAIFLVGKGHGRSGEEEGGGRGVAVVVRHTPLAVHSSGGAWWQESFGR